MYIPPHETLKIAGLLAIVGGFLDAYTYFLRGQVFANAQTGNIVLVAVGLAKGSLKQALIPVAPILAFMLGVLITEIIKRQCSESGFMMWEHFVIIIEMVLLLIVGFIPQTVSNAVANVTISLICSIQVCSFRKIKGMNYASTMCTGNLRSGTETLFKGVVEKDERQIYNSLHYFAIIGLFIFGAFIGGICAMNLGVRSIWICCALLLAVFLMMTIDNGRDVNKKKM